MTIAEAIGKRATERFAVRGIHVETLTWNLNAGTIVMLKIYRGEYGRYIPDGDDDLIGRAEIGNKYIAVWNPRAYEDARIIHYNAVDPDFDPEIAINQLMELLGIQL